VRYVCGMWYVCICGMVWCVVCMRIRTCVRVSEKKKNVHALRHFNREKK